MKSQKELEQLKQECKELNYKLSELSEEELSQVCGGSDMEGFWDVLKKIGEGLKNII